MKSPVGIGPPSKTFKLVSYQLLPAHTQKRTHAGYMSRQRSPLLNSTRLRTQTAPLSMRTQGEEWLIAVTAEAIWLLPAHCHCTTWLGKLLLQHSRLYSVCFGWSIFNRVEFSTGLKMPESVKIAD